jgi:hypothetical protein
MRLITKLLTTTIYTYHSCFIPEGVAEVSLIFLRDTHVVPKLVRNTTDVTGGKPIAVLLQSIKYDDTTRHMTRHDTTSIQHQMCTYYVFD